MATTKGAPVADRAKGAYKPTSRATSAAHKVLVALGQAPARSLTDTQPFGPSGAPALGVARALAYAMAYQNAEQHNQTANLLLAGAGYSVDRPVTHLHPCWHPGLVAVYHYHVEVHPDWGRVHVGKRRTDGVGVLTAHCAVHGHKQAACTPDCKVAAWSHHLGVALPDHLGAGAPAPVAEPRKPKGKGAVAPKPKGKGKGAGKAVRVRTAPEVAEVATTPDDVDAVANATAADVDALGALTEAGL